MKTRLLSIRYILSICSNSNIKFILEFEQINQLRIIIVYIINYNNSQLELNEFIELFDKSTDNTNKGHKT